ncbi:DNA polymerase subunit Cdc27 [Podospora australis]|uniref:DNA polymerase delta subunit 3 n=1 Tax=Podospora australis TaxID=1536484 RepID=A0AAN6X5M0_9PEZI|nr:DNA polymerase subunit Cdc27 [Podospora australis]
MEKYMEWLANNVLIDDKVVSYRVLSRALKVHVNTAKQMLYEFHRSQNAKHAGTIHATYVVYGVKTADAQNNGADDDVEMAHSGSESQSIPDVVPTYTLSLVAEEHLKDVLAEYDEVSSIHIYSVAPRPTKDITLLSDVATGIEGLSLEEHDKKIVPITNSRVRRRERKAAGIRAAAAAAPVKNQVEPAPKKSGPVPPGPSKLREELKPDPTPPKEEKAAAPEKPAAAPVKKPAPALKRGASSGIMQAFSKAASLPKKEKPAETSIQPLSDDGEDDGEDDEEMPQPKPRAKAGVKSKKEREEELRRMMEQEDEVKSEKAESEEPEPMEEEEPPAPEPVKEDEGPSEVAETSNGRRRGKRKVMRKKQIMDDQGYLVTIQEPGWESFSEDEAPPPQKVKPNPPPAAPAPSKGKKGAAKGQGNIMSFFSKKT